MTFRERTDFMRMLTTLFFFALFGRPVHAQSVAPPAPREWTTAEDHRQMMEQLGITALRPGPSGNEQAPNHANYDESLANPFPVWPPLLTLRSDRQAAPAQAAGAPPAWGTPDRATARTDSN